MIRIIIPLPANLLIKTTLAPALILSLSAVNAHAQTQSNFSVSPTQLCSLQGDGRVSCSISPGFTDRNPPGDLPPLTAVTVGDAHACGITNEGQAVCWGINSLGQLNAPTVELPLTQINAGQNHTCALDAAGEAICWGLNSNRQLEVPRGSTFTKIDAGFTSSCGILNSGDITCWSTDGARSVDLFEGPFTDLDITEQGVCGVTLEGELLCARYVPNEFENPYDIETFFDASLDGPYIDMAASTDAICVLDSNSRLICEFLLDDWRVEALNLLDAYPLGEQFRSIQSEETEASRALPRFDDDGPNRTELYPGALMCGERMDGSFQCWGSQLNPLDEQPNTMVDITTRELFLDARVYGTDVEIFWAPINLRRQRDGQLPVKAEVEVIRNGAVVTRTAAQFSYFDSAAEANNEYQIRLIDGNGNASPLSAVLSVNTETGQVLFDGKPPVTTLVQPTQDEVITHLNLYCLTGFSLFFAGWDIDPDYADSIERYDIRVNGMYRGSTHSRLFASPNEDYRFLEIIAVGKDGTVLDVASRSGCEF